MGAVLFGGCLIVLAPKEEERVLRQAGGHKDLFAAFIVLHVHSI